MPLVWGKEKGVQQKPLAILTADWHLRHDNPICRTDDFQKEQFRKILFIQSVQKRLGYPPILHAGDLFNKHTVPLWFLHKTINHFLRIKKFYTIIGNHDVPGHNVKDIDKSALGIMEAAGVVRVLYLAKEIDRDTVVFPVNWGESIYDYNDDIKQLQDDGNNVIVLAHEMTYYVKAPFPGCDADSSSMILKKSPADVIVTGHNHQSFMAVSRDDKILINPGSLMRQTASQETHRPAIFILNRDYTVERVEIPIAKGVITRDHIKGKKEEKDNFIASLEYESDEGLDFENEVESVMKEVKARPLTKKEVFKAINGGKDE